MANHGSIAIQNGEHGNLYGHHGSMIPKFLTCAFTTAYVFCVLHLCSHRVIDHLPTTFKVLYSTVPGSHEACVDPAHLSRFHRALKPIPAANVFWPQEDP